MEALVAGSIVFYQLRRARTNTLLAILITMLSAAALAYYFIKEKPPSSTDFGKLVEGRAEVVSPNYTVATFGTRKFRFLVENKMLVDILNDMKFTRIFDKGRYGDLLIHMDKFQKTYMYILAGRYRPESYMASFTDLRNLILEILYSYIFIIPEALKHSYGVNPYDIIHKNIDKFTSLTRTMMYTMAAYCKGKGYIIPDTYLSPYENTRTTLLP
jgi:hypothetical protein